MIDGVLVKAVEGLNLGGGKNFGEVFCQVVLELVFWFDL